MAAKSLVTCIQVLFMVFNFVFCLSGLALLVAGILVKTSFMSFIQLSTKIDYNLAPYIMIGCGVFIILIGICGCVASLKEQVWALKIYMAILLLLFLAEVAGAVAGYVMRNKMKEGLKEGLQRAIHNYANDTGIRDAVDKIQNEAFGCCGVTTYKDWFVDGNNKTVPKSCCLPHGKCLSDNLPKDIHAAGIYTEGCYDKMLEVAMKNFKIVGGVALGIAVFQLLGVVCGYILTKAFFENNLYETI